MYFWNSCIWIVDVIWRCFFHTQRWTFSLRPRVNSTNLSHHGQSIKSTKESAAAWILLHVARKFLGTSKFAKPSAPSLSLSILYFTCMLCISFVSKYISISLGGWHWLTLARDLWNFMRDCNLFFCFCTCFFFETANMQHIEIFRAFGCIFALKAVPTWIMSHTYSP